MCCMHMCRQTPKHITGCQVWIVNADHFPLLNESPHLYEMRANGCDIMSNQRKSDSCVSISYLCICFVFVGMTHFRLVWTSKQTFDSIQTIKKSFMGYWSSLPLLTRRAHCNEMQKKWSLLGHFWNFCLLQFMLMLMRLAAVQEISSLSSKHCRILASWRLASFNHGPVTKRKI